MRLILLGVLWVVALLVAVKLSETLGIEQTVQAAGQRLLLAAWVLPLAGAVSSTVLTSQRARRRWPQRTRRVQLGLGASVGLYGLIAAVGISGTVLVLGLAAIAGLLAAWVLVLPLRLAPPLPADTLETLGHRDRLELTDARLKLQNDLRTTALQAIAGLAVLAGAVLAFQQLTEDRQQSTATRELTLQSQASERFTNAIDQLGSDRTEVRLGGIYGLEQVAQQAPDNRLAVAEVLVAYLHRSSPLPAEPATHVLPELRVRAPEVQAALTVLIRRRIEPLDPALDLSGLDLRGANIAGALAIESPDSTDLSFKAGQLRYADLRRTDLRGAMFSGVFMNSAKFRGADLRGATFKNVDLGLDFLQSSSGIETADFHDALADGRTIWPQRFDWQSAGIKMS